MAEMKELTLHKNTERFVFRYEPGDEEMVLDTIVNMANDSGNSFDWFDAAVLSFQLSKNLVEEADRLLCPEPSQDAHWQKTSEPWSSPW